MNEPRNAHAITLCRGQVYVLGGFSGKQRLNSVERYSIKEDKWTPMAPMKDKRHYLSACQIGDEFIYAFGGFYGSTEQEINDSIEVYEIEKNVWTALAARMKVTFKLTSRILFGLAVLSPSPTTRSSSLAAKTPTETVKCSFSTSNKRLGNSSIQ